MIKSRKTSNSISALNDKIAIPGKYLLDSIKESEKERKNKKYYSFKNNDKALEFLK